MSGWTCAICERCWLDRNSGEVELDGERTLQVRIPVRVLGDITVEHCGVCGQRTIFGAYIRLDPAEQAAPIELDR